MLSFFFFFTDPATPEIYTLSLHDALPISADRERSRFAGGAGIRRHRRDHQKSEEHTSELQSHVNLVCRLLLEKKKKKYTINQNRTTLPDSNARPSSTAPRSTGQKAPA